jgi:hypothetical protein
MSKFVRIHFETAYSSHETSELVNYSYIIYTRSCWQKDQEDMNHLSFDFKILMLKFCKWELYELSTI